MANKGGRPAEVQEPPELIEVRDSPDPAERIVAHHFGHGLAPLIERQVWSSISEKWVGMGTFQHVRELPPGKHITHKCIHCTV